MFISLPGLTLAIDEVAKFEMVMETARKAIHDFINDEPDDVKVYEMATLDSKPSGSSISTGWEYPKCNVNTLPDFWAL